MIPNRVAEDNASTAELRLFDKMRAELTDDWVVLHSLGLLVHKKKPWSEIDFVLIGPQGVFCLEVKGGRLSRNEGIWSFTDRHGMVHQKTEGPFDQVGSASAALYSFLRDARPSISESLTGFGVVTPDIRFEIKGPDIQAELVYDCTDAGRPFNSYIERLVAYWERRLGKPTPRQLDSIERAALFTLLRRDFELIPSLEHHLNLVGQQLLRLTDEQYGVLDGLRDNERVIVRGGAGTGKTLLAVEEARRRSQRGQKVLLCCFNRKLATFLADVLKTHKTINVRHIHGLMADYVHQAGLTNQLPDAQQQDLFQVFYPQYCLDALIKLDRLGEYDVLIVDEAQDLLLDPYIDVLDGLLQGGLRRGPWRFFLDPNQNIFNGIASEPSRRLAECAPAQFRLSINCRNTAPIGIMTSLLAGIHWSESLRAEGPEVQTYWHSDAAQERRLVSKCIGRMLSQGIAPERITILSRRHLSDTCVAQGLIGVRACIADLTCSSDSHATGTIQFATISLFKGLESDVVILVDCDDLKSSEGRMLLYVGASRARALLAVFLPTTVRLDYDARAFEYGRRLQQAAQ